MICVCVNYSMPDLEEVKTVGRICPLFMEDFMPTRPRGTMTQGILNYQTPF